MEKIYRFVPRFNPVVLFAGCMGVFAAFLLAGVRPGDPTSIVAALLVLGVIAVTLYRQKSGLQRVVDRRLVLGDEGLRYEISGQGYSVSWSQCDHRVERAGRDAEVKAVTLVTREGEWLTLNGFEDMPQVVTTLRQRVPVSGPRGFAEAALLSQWWPGWLSGGAALLGMYMFAGSKQLISLPADQYRILAIVLVAPCLLAAWYGWSRSPLLKLGRAVQQQGSGSASRRFFITLAVWVAIVVVVLVVLNFWVPKHA
jgi:hypothetical protein